MKDSYKNILIVVLLLAVLYLLFFRKEELAIESQVNKSEQSRKLPETNTGNKIDYSKETGQISVDIQEIDKLTAEEKVVPYVKQYGKLPDYYLTKGQARNRGWVAAKGNLCEVLPGMAIGGDVFTNRQKLLPVKNGRKWFEADLNYNCGRRNADRILFSNDGLVYVTHDHYKTVEQK